MRSSSIVTPGKTVDTVYMVALYIFVNKKPYLFNNIFLLYKTFKASSFL